jgi:hypothetical protein
LWVKRRYAPGQPYVITDYAPNEGRPDLTISKCFIPSTLEDNPALMATDPSYEARLAAAGSDALFRAWRYGDWDVISGAYFDVFDEDRHVVKARDLQIEPWWPVWISGDWGYEDFSAIHWHAMREDRSIVTFQELYVNHKGPDELAYLIAAMNGSHKPGFFFFSRDAFAKRTSPRTIADEMGEVLAAKGLPWPSRADTDRVGGWSLMHQLFRSDMWTISDACPALIEAIPLLQRDEKDVEDVASSPVDHAPDSARYGLKTYLAPRQQAEHEKALKRLDQFKDPETGQITNYTAYNMMAQKLDYERRKADKPIRLRRYAV